MQENCGHRHGADEDTDYQDTVRWKLPFVASLILHSGDIAIATEARKKKTQRDVKRKRKQGKGEEERRGTEMRESSPPTLCYHFIRYPLTTVTKLFYVAQTFFVHY